MSDNMAYRKKLIEVALPLEAINKESAREKSIRHGHPSTLHIWWSRKPLATCRAVLFASLVDDPSSWPELFITEAEQNAERQRLFSIIEDLVIWENSNNSAVLLRTWTEIARSISRNLNVQMPQGPEAIKAFIAERAPPVLDPFCGGGSIPLEAQRLGLKNYGSDLNPVAVLITKALIEIPSKFAGITAVNPESRKDKKLNGSWHGAKGLAEDVRYYGKWVRNEAEQRIGHLYPKIKITEDILKKRPDLKDYAEQEFTVIAWLWARTVPSPDPAVNGRSVPLASKFWLCSKKGKETWLDPVVDKTNNNYQFEIKIASGNQIDRNTISKGTKLGKGASFRCLISGETISKEYIHNEFRAKRNGLALMAIVLDGPKGRLYIEPNKEQELIALSANPEWVPEEYMNQDTPNLVSGRGYGIEKWNEIFTRRQLTALSTFSDLIKEARQRVLEDAKIVEDNEHSINANEYADAIATYLAFGLSRQANRSSMICVWNHGGEKVEQTLARQAIPMSWDFAEANVLSKSTGSWEGSLEWIPEILENLPTTTQGYSSQLDATVMIESISSSIISTDPPYYDNIGYADLSDFFYIWLRKTISDIYPSLFATVLTPKKQELIASTYRHNGNEEEAKKYFEHGLSEAFEKIHQTHNYQYPLTIYYGFKQAETNSDEEVQVTASTGWETMLEGVRYAGFSIIGTWPMHTEREKGLKSGTNSLASSIVLVCRPRPENAPIATRREFISALKNELPPALHTLKQGNIAPVDLAQAMIGPGMAIFTRYIKVLEADGSSMIVRTALGLINQTLDELLIEQEGDFDADTRWAVSWFEQYGMNEGPFGDAETLSKAKNTVVDGLTGARIICAQAGKVKLISWRNLSANWDPTNDSRLTVWSTTQHLIRALDINGENGAAEILQRIGNGMGDNSRDLAYRLYGICEHKKWTQDALTYNSLITSWPQIVNIVQSLSKSEKGQQLLFE